MRRPAQTDAPPAGSASASASRDGEGRPARVPSLPRPPQPPGPARAPGPGAPDWTRPRRIGAAATAAGLAALLTGLLAAGGRPRAAPAGLPDAGPLTGWALPVARLAADLAAVGTVGLLVVGAVLLRTAGPPLAPAARRPVRLAGLWAAGWAVLALLQVPLAVSDTVGVPLARLPLAAVGEQLTTSRVVALLVTGGLAAAVAAGTPRARTQRQGRRLLLVALAGLLPAAVTGHAATAADHDLATTSLVVHVLAAAVWVGGLAALVLALRRRPGALAVAAARFSPLALGCFVVLAGSGLLAAVTRIGASPSAWASGYGALLLGKAAALVALGVLGDRHRRLTLARLALGRPGAFLRFAAVEVVLMTTAVGLAAALSRTPLPDLPVAAAAPTHGAGHETLPATLEPVGIAPLLTAWRLDALELTALGLGVAAYLLGVRRLREAGEAWPARRVAALAAGAAVALLTLVSGLATYAPAMVSAQIGQFLLALVAVPALVMLSAPLTLWLRVRALSDPADPVPPALRSAVARRLADPFTGFALVAGLVFVVYRTPLVELSLRSSWVHLLVLAATLAAGAVLLWPVLGVDPVPEPRAPAERALAVGATAAGLALLAAQLRYGEQLLAGRWFLELRWDWVDPVHDQALGGTLVAGAALLLPLALLPALRRPSPALPPAPAGVKQRPATARRRPARRPAPPSRRGSAAAG